MTFSCLLADYQQTDQHRDAQKWWIVTSWASGEDG